MNHQPLFQKLKNTHKNIFNPRIHHQLCIQTVPTHTQSFNKNNHHEFNNIKQQNHNFDTFKSKSQK